MLPKTLLENFLLKRSPPLLVEQGVKWQEWVASVPGHGLVGDAELTQVVANYLWLDFHLVEGAEVATAHRAAYHLQRNNHIP